MHRFVLLYHQCPPGYERPSHWDLMLEADGKLRTWALAQLPRDWGGIRQRTAAVDPDCPTLGSDNLVDAEQLPDHRLDYLHEEGPLTNNRGDVTRMDEGTYITQVESENRWVIALTGREVRGHVTLRQHAPGGVHWTLALDQSSS